MNGDRSIAYFSMEIGLESAIPTYSGGLGVLAGDTIRSAADLRVPMVAMTLLHRKGYFSQRLDDVGTQAEEPAVWRVEDYMKEMAARAEVRIENRVVVLRCWKHDVKGLTGHSVPVFFLDADLPENSPNDRHLTDYLYGGDLRYRLCQEVILGFGGVRMLRALGYDGIRRFHMNEGHASFLTLQLVSEHVAMTGHKLIEEEDVETIRRKCVFTTHTPVPAGHDRFPPELLHEVVGMTPGLGLKSIYDGEGKLNMTSLALEFSSYVNGVAKKHGEVSRLMFSGFSIDSITNGVHVPTWTSAPMQKVFDRYIPGWKQDNFSLRYAVSIPKQEIWKAHAEAKKELIDYVNRTHNGSMDEETLTIGFARRTTAYKRPDLIFWNMKRLVDIADTAGKFQLIFAGKAHPRDTGGKAIIKRIFEAEKLLEGKVKIAFVENYDMDLGKLITSGVDLWLNNPKPPLEASGTSGMKAALNGVPSLSVLDGWWIEGWIEGLTGWAIGGNSRRIDETDDPSRDANSMYDKLEKIIIPMFYHDRDAYINVMIHAIALNGSFFNTERMMQEYVLKAYFS
jgi:starch phosphorylase